MFWLHEWSWWDSILPTNSKKQGVVGHCYGLNPRLNVKLPKYIIWWGLNSQSQYQKENLVKKKKWTLYQIPHSAAQGLFATAVQFRWKKKYSPALTSPTVKSPKCCFHFVPSEMSEREITLYFQFTCYCTWGKALDSIYYFPFLPALFPHPKYPLKPLSFWFKQQG